MAMEKEKAPADLTLKRVFATHPYADERERLEHGDVAVVRIGGWVWGGRPSLAVIDTVFSREDKATKLWLEKTASLLRDHALRAPLVVGLVALRGRAPSGSAWARGHPQQPDNPIRCIAICVGGTHALVYQPDCSLGNEPGGPLLVFKDGKMKEVHELLGDKRVTVACLGAADVAQKLAAEWGLRVGRPAELTDLFARAHGDVDKVPGVEPWKLSSKALQHEGGGRVPKAIDCLAIEHMARVALGPEMRLAPMPPKVAAADWGGRDLTCDAWKYATRDAYLAFDIAAHCLQKLGAEIGWPVTVTASTTPSPCVGKGI